MRGRPPWWPDGEAWPPMRGSRHQWGKRGKGGKGRRDVVRWFALVFGAFLLLSGVGAATLISAIVDRAGFSAAVGPAPILGVMFWIAILCSGAVFVRVIRRVGVPVGDIVTASNHVADGDFSVRVPENGPHFIRSVAAAFNTMTARLEAQADQRRQLMADIAHELRTPLSVMQGRIEGILDGVYPHDDGQLEDLLDHTRTLGRLVEDVRTLANAEAGALVLHREPTDVSTLAAGVASAFEPQATATHVVITTDVPAGPALMDVDPTRLREVLSNLVANALQHTPAGGRVTLRVARLEDRITIQVIDTGTGIAPEDLPRIFDRFYKGAESRGSGLGLAIARRLVLAHGGSITATSEHQKGTTMTVTLPVASSSA